MLGCDIFHKINSRLKQITAVHDENLEGFHIVMCGDLKTITTNKRDSGLQVQSRYVRRASTVAITIFVSVTAGHAAE